MPLMIEPGSRIGTYEVIAHLRENAAGATWLARHTGSGLEVEVRLLPVERDDLTARRLQREVEALMAVRHPGIVRVWAFGRERGHDYIVMEHVIGMSLGYWLGQLGKLRVADAVQVHVHLLKALSDLHRRGLVHRDVNPEAVVLSEDGRTVLRDLLMARTEIGDGEGTLLDDDELTTGLYKAPEQIDGGADARSDLYSVGVSLYHCVSGRLPFDGAGSVAVLARCESPAIPLSVSLPGVSPLLEQAVMRLLERDPDKRFSSTDEAIAALSRSL
ncbi:MAG: serine/threonine-protein kinase [Planctomycetota bacterium]